jgi:hypothetical protein
VTTYCNKCAHVFRVYKNDPPSRWLCTRHKRHPGWKFTYEGYDQEPYGRCDQMNLGLCPLFEEAQPERQINHTKELT